MISSIMCAVGIIVAIECCGGLDLATRGWTQLKDS